MLTLTRRRNQTVVITPPYGPEIRVTVVEFRGGGKIRLGFDCPRDVVVDRLEVHEAKQRDLAGPV